MFVLFSAPNIHFHGKTRICTYTNNYCTVITTFLLTQIVIQSQVFGLVGFPCTLNERACVCFYGINNG